MLRHLQCQLPRVRFKRRLCSRYRAVSLKHRDAAGAGHAEHAATAPQQTVAPEVLYPIDQAVSHHVKRHFHLRLRKRLRCILADERQQRAKRHRVHQDVNGLRALGCGGQNILHPGDCIGAPLHIRDVHVHEVRLNAAAFQLCHQLLHAFQRRATVEMQPDDVYAIARQFKRRRSAKTARCTQDQRPFTFQICLRHRLLLFVMRTGLRIGQL